MIDYSDLSNIPTEKLIEMIQKEAGNVPVADLLKAWADAPASEREREVLRARGTLAREISEPGYKNLYWCLTRREYPKSHMPILRGLLKAYKEKKGVMVQAWRGIGKSTDLLVWVLLLLGNNPVGSMAFIRINDTKAQESGDAIAMIIENSFAWKACFPNVIPDEKAGWSKKAGFFVQDTNIVNAEGGYSRWREMCFADHTSEASLVCAGIESGMLIGLHPTNGEWFDDLHDEKNTKSATEMKNVVDMFDGNVLPTWTDPKRPMTFAVVCTPWDSDNDVYAFMLGTGLLELVKIPIFTDDPEGEMFEPLNRRVKLTWPEVYTMEAVVRIWNSQQMNPKRFWQMFLLDDKAGRAGAVYKYYTIGHETIRKTEWLMDAGIDPVYSDKKEGGTSHFCMLYGLRIPMGGVCVSGGILEKCSASAGMGYVVQTQRTYPNFNRAWCETYGGGALFVQMVQQNPGVRINPIESKQLPNEKKGDRQYTFLQPLLASGFFFISDEDIPILNVLRNYLNRYPNISSPLAPEWDVADALVALLYGYFDVRARAVNSANDQMTEQLFQRTRLGANSFRPPRIHWNEWRG
ncbi:MAG: hypothetical protein EHM40_02835 [Chloroflexi bacterium]|nr:MAG: hypothetical protein EHM40_02835 [Chloroflexota bacterium]